MSSLAKALDARRKAIAGMSNSSDNSSRKQASEMEKGVSKTSHSDGENSGEDEWK
ncbi:unnamed protein product [Nippostrongylus brasiliensis]|uniref:Uncharacterized protein n=1 Tax=Nippostrongylus brasiliensis TaxID=27835 RepID=A0A0N4YNA2_NIPBR|nr:unnamed protein product [Nippostrongylus brasiliensis]